MGKKGWIRGGVNGTIMGSYSISMTQAKTPSAATFQVLLHTSLLDRRGDLPYCIISFSPGMYNTLINAHLPTNHQPTVPLMFTSHSILILGIISYLSIIMRVTRNVQQWIMKVHQCQLSFILITNSPHL